MTDERGLFEHALFDTPRPEHGYCVDDVARALLLLVREREPTAVVARLTENYLRFLEAAVVDDGRCHNRMDADGRWSDEPSTEDWWGRAIWALGTASVVAPTPLMRKRSRRAFDRAVRQTSAEHRSMVFAALGAGEVVLAGGDEPRARHLIREAVQRIGAEGPPEWPWPEGRLRYANGCVAEALILAGSALEDSAVQDRGLRLLQFLLDVESDGSMFSVTGSAGRDPGQTGPLFDQQPIEVAALAEASLRAYELTGDDRWAAPVLLAWQWFEGRNDSGVVMFRAEDGAGYDGLEPDGRNENRGAESTVAALATHSAVRRLSSVPVVMASP